MCEGPGAGMLAWPECREGGTVRQPRGDDLCLKGEVGSLPLHLFPLHFSSLYTFVNVTMVWLHLNASEIKSLMLIVLSDAKASFVFGSFLQNAVCEFQGRI